LDYTHVVFCPIGDDPRQVRPLLASWEADNAGSIPITGSMLGIATPPFALPCSTLKRVQVALIIRGRQDD
jgi:hypothetical protein